jgi:hypothetical protein
MADRTRYLRPLLLLLVFALGLSVAFATAGLDARAAEEEPKETDKGKGRGKGPKPLPTVTTPPLPTLPQPTDTTPTGTTPTGTSPTGTTPTGTTPTGTTPTGTPAPPVTGAGSPAPTPPPGAGTPPPAAVPAAFTGGAQAVTARGATVLGTAMHAGVGASFRFDVGITAAYGLRTPLQPLPAGSAQTVVSAVLSGLRAGATYHYRLVVVTPSRVIVGADATLTTNAAPGRRAFGPVTGFDVSIVGNRVVLRWQLPASPLLARVIVVRRLGARPTGPRSGTVIYRRKGRTVVDFPLSRRRVWYAAYAVDRRGRVARGAFKSIPRFMPALCGPRDGARVLSGARLRFSWRPTAGATYYNIQIWRAGRPAVRVLTTWPRRTQYVLSRRLTRGVYSWYVFPGYGTMSAARYGRLVGQSTFTVR